MEQPGHKTPSLLVAALLAALVSALAAPALAQDAGSEPVLYGVYIEHVPPAKMQAYEKATRELIDAFREHDVDPAKVGFRAASGPEVGYAYLLRIGSFAGMEQVQANWAEAIETIGQTRWDRIAARTDAAVERREFFHALHRPELSFEPEERAVAGDDAEFLNYDFYYAIPGKEEDLEQVARDYVDLYERLGMKSGWEIYQIVTGSDLPLYVVVQSGRSPAEFYARMARDDEKLGEDAAKLDRRALSLVRRLESKTARIRRELSYMPR